LLLAGCSADVCAPYDGQTCIALTLLGDSSPTFDRVGITIPGIFDNVLSPPDGPRPFHLPADIAILPGELMVARTIDVQVDAFRDTVLRAQARPGVFPLAPRQHRALSVDLLPVTPDLGPDVFPSTPPDLAATDLFASDLADAFITDFAVTDFAPGPDLLAVDLLPQFCDTVTVSTLAGDGTNSFLDAQGTAARFANPTGIAVDAAGNVYVADQFNNRIRKIAPDATVTTLAGNGTPGFVDGTGGPVGTTEFSGPSGVAVDGSGIVYVGDFTNRRVRKVAADGTTTTLAGNGSQGSFDGTGGAGGTTTFNNPWGLAVDGSGTVFVIDSSASLVRRIATDGSTTTMTGLGGNGFFDGTAATTRFNFPTGLVIDGAGVEVVDYGNNRIRVVAPNGDTTTLAGNGNLGTTDGTGGPAGTTEFSGPIGIARDPATGDLYIGEQNTSRIRRVKILDGSTITITGTVGSGFQDGSGCTARFNSIQGVAFSGKKIFVADMSNQRIRVVQLP
jgi:NHL repeat